MFRKLFHICIIAVIFYFGWDFYREFAANAKAESVIIDADELNIRSGPGISYQVVEVAQKGEIFAILERQNGWIKLQLGPGKTGWAASWFVKAVKNDSTGQTEAVISNEDSLRIRSGPGTGFDIIGTLEKGREAQLLEQKEKWMKIKTDGMEGWVAASLVTVSEKSTEAWSSGRKAQVLSDKKILIDPGHGGKDRGTKGENGTLEKDLNLKTALLLKEKLESAGAKVTLTRTADHFITLKSRVHKSKELDADAFISLHYDSSKNTEAEGITTYYYHSSKSRALGTRIHNQLKQKAPLNDRGVRVGDYYVLRKNSQPSVLLELGYLSNEQEENTVKTSDYQEKAASGIVNGLVQYFEYKEKN